ncbi:MAG: pilus assembly protein TadE [Acidobacteriales bacterium]|nr:pilus assembly protein TadE [Terriglobales bacterium]
MRLRNQGRNCRGATVLETALVLPILFAVLFGILEFGRAYNMFQAVTDAAREGARYSVAPIASGLPNAGTLPSPSTQVIPYVQYFLKGDGITVPNSNIVVVQNCSGTTACPAVNGTTGLQYTKVTVTAPYKFIYFPFGTLNISSQSVMRNENN